jgi:hypothetical protein
MVMHAFKHGNSGNKSRRLKPNQGKVSKTQSQKTKCNTKGLREWLKCESKFKVLGSTTSTLPYPSIKETPFGKSSI